MKRHPAEQKAVPSVDQLTAELMRTRYKRRFSSTLLSTFLTLVLIVLISFVASHFFFPVLRMHSNAMAPAFQTGDLVVALKGSSYSKGDVIAFYFNDKLLVKRVIAVAGDTVEIDGNGSVLLDDEQLSEPYVQTPALGDCDLEMPYTIPENRVFVMGDQRETSLDSRNTAIGCIAAEQVVGRVILRVWPLDQIDFYTSAAAAVEED